MARFVRIDSQLRANRPHSRCESREGSRTEAPLSGLGSPRPGRRSPRTPAPQKSEQSLEKVLGPSRPKSLEKKSRGAAEKSRKSPKMGFFETFRPLPENFFRLWGARVRGLFRDFVQTLGREGPRTPPPRPGRSQPLVGKPRFGALTGNRRFEAIDSCESLERYENTFFLRIDYPGPWRYF